MAQTLREFKAKRRLTTEEICTMFGITERQVYYYQDMDCVVQGKAGERKIIQTRKIERAAEVAGA